MSKEALAKVVQRAISDAAFRRQLNSDPAGALRGFDLSADEASALRTGDAGRLSSLGVDQRMSKSFMIGGLASTRTAGADLTPGGGPAVVDDLSGAGSRTIIPADPTRPGGSDDIDGATAGSSTVRTGDDWKFAGRVAPEGTGSVRTGDDWKYAEKNAGGSMANYPAHDGLAGPSGISSVRIGDDWKFASTTQGSVAPVEGSPEATAADIASGGAARANVIHDDPDGFLAANANADTGGSVTPTVIHDDPNGFLAANEVGYDSSAAASPEADTTWSGDDIAGPSSIADDVSGTANPHVATDEGQLTS
jgi:hypothetical protein